MKKTVFIGTPAYQGQVHVQYALALLDTNELLKANGYEVMIRVPIGGSLLVADRNRLVEMFWQSGADYMLCIDSDLAWDPQAVMRFINADKDFCAGVYPARKGRTFTFRPAVHDDNRIVMCPATKLLKMQYVPAGFMLFKREVIKTMRDKYPELYYSPKDDRSQTESAYCFFDTEVWQGEFWGEDYVFCRRARNAGFDIWCDPTIQFNHDGVCGSLIETLTDDPTKAEKIPS